MWKLRFNVIYISGLLVLTAGSCSQLPFQGQSAITGVESDVATLPVEELETDDTKQDTREHDSPPVSKGRQQILEMGTGEYVTDAPPIEEFKSKPGNITLNFQDTDIREFHECRHQGRTE